MDDAQNTVSSAVVKRRLQPPVLETDLPLHAARAAWERRYLLTRLNRLRGNVAATARAIGIERAVLHRKLRALGLSRGEWR